MATRKLNTPKKKLPKKPIKKVPKKPRVRRTMRKVIEGQVYVPVVQKCDLDHICNYLQSLSDYLQLFNADYRKVRIAVCNLDLAVFHNGGNLSDTLCTGGTAGEPADPPPTPVW